MLADENAPEFSSPTVADLVGPLGPLDHSITITVFPDTSAKSKVQKQISLRDLAKFMPDISASTKDQLQLLKLSKFGDEATDKGCLRTDKNVLAITGIEADYDGEEIALKQAADNLHKAKVAALLYTSPSHTAEKPRWRVLCPVSKELPTDQRAHLVSRLNGVLGDILAPESWKLSQSYYYGSIYGKPACQVELIEGDYIDQRFDLDAGVAANLGPASVSSAHTWTADFPSNAPEYGTKALKSECELVVKAPWGLQEQTLNNAALKIGKHVAHGNLDLETARAKLIEAGMQIANQPAKDKWTPAAIASKVKHGLEDGIKKVNEEGKPPGIAGALIQQAADTKADISIEDFYAYMPSHNYIFAPSREHWPASSVNGRLPAVELTDANGMPLLDDEGKPKTVPPAAWLDKHRPVEQVTWAPGHPMIINDKLILEGGWIDRQGVTVFNQYRAPEIAAGDPAKADKWFDHIKYIYHDEAEHILDWLAHCIQHPQDKINHALVLGGNQGIGKDTLLEPIKRAIGDWNFKEVSPKQVLGRFNGFLKSVILRVSEVRDLGEHDRFSFYDHMKSYTAAPPDTLRIDEKHLKEYNIINCCGVIITTNHKNDGIFLSPDDRRHFVAWSERAKEDERFQSGYWNDMWGYYHSGGFGHIAAFLRERDISGFDPKASPPKTVAWWSIVDSNRSPQEAWLADAIDKLGNPDAFTLRDLHYAAMQGGMCDLISWLDDPKTTRTIPHRLEKCGYTPVRNEEAKDGLWKICGKRQVIYANKALTLQARDKAAQEAKQKAQGFDS
jgi:Family of unknown function (DUF5906)